MGRGGALAKPEGRSLKRFGNTSTFYKMISVQYKVKTKFEQFPI